MCDQAPPASREQTDEQTAPGDNSQRAPTPRSRSPTSIGESLTTVRSLLGGVRSSTRVLHGSLLLAIGLTIFVAPAAAQSGPSAICSTDLAQTIRNILTMIQYGGPLLGGTVGVGAMVLKPYLRGEDLKRQAKQLRDGAFIWGVIAAPLAVTAIQFLLNNIVAGGSTCGF